MPRRKTFISRKGRTKGIGITRRIHSRTGEFMGFGKAGRRKSGGYTRAKKRGR